jgi:hypothetical protein
MMERTRMTGPKDSPAITLPIFFCKIVLRNEIIIPGQFGRIRVRAGLFILIMSGYPAQMQF